VRRPRSKAMIALWIYCIVVFLFLLLPLAIVVPVSFSSAQYLQFPPPGLSTQWYAQYFHDVAWRDATFLSLKVAAGVVVLSVSFGALAGFALVRTRFPGKAVIRVFLMTPLIVPTIVVAVAVYSMYVRLQLVGNVWGIILAHTILALPFTVMLMAAGFERVDRGLEEASLTMGASPWRTFWKVTVPIIWANVLAAAVFAFVTSWDEVIMVLFIAGTAGMTLPLKMFSYLQTEINPVIASVSTLLLALVALALVLSEIGGARQRRRRERSTIGAVRT
jgi:putative spermidine/putrescine transport system permease protein